MFPFISGIIILFARDGNELTICIQTLPYIHLRKHRFVVGPQFRFGTVGFKKNYVMIKQCILVFIYAGVFFFKEVYYSAFHNIL